MNKLSHGTRRQKHRIRVGMPVAMVQTSTAKFLFHPVLPAIHSTLAIYRIERDHSA